MAMDTHDADGVPNTLPHMSRGEFLSRLGAAQAQGYEMQADSQWWISHTFDCPFFLVNEPEPCQHCGNLLALTNPSLTAFVAHDLVPYFVRLH